MERGASSYAESSPDTCFYVLQSASFFGRFGMADGSVVATADQTFGSVARESGPAELRAVSSLGLREQNELFFDFKPPKRHPFHLGLKRVFDILGAGFGLLILLPIFVAVALMIKATSPGPVFFRQNRTGLGNTTFQILKFRSMHVDLCDATGVTQTVAGDARITTVGRFLRRSNLDELPQLLNVLRGDMSLVGPRPHVPGMLAAGQPYEQLVSGYERRHMMRPGITGLAQVHGLRGPTTEPEPAVQRIQRDLEYIRDFSILLDIKIILRTLVNELRGGSGF